MLLWMRRSSTSYVSSISRVTTSWLFLNTTRVRRLRWSHSSSITQSSAGWLLVRVRRMRFPSASYS